MSLLDRLIVMDPQDPELYRRRILLNKQLGHYDLIAADAETLQRVLPHTGEELAALALFVSDLSDAADESNRYALIIAERAVAVAPNDADTWRNRAELQRLRG